MNNRRKLVIALGVSALAAPLGSFAQQQGKIWRVGFLAARHVDFVDSDHYYGPFRQGMHELGYVEGKNLVIEWRSAEGKNERLSGLATELVNLKVDVIVAAATPASSAAQKATTTIPIVMGGGGDPVGAGLVKSLARIAGRTRPIGDDPCYLNSVTIGLLPCQKLASLQSLTSNAEYRLTIHKSISDNSSRILPGSPGMRPACGPER